jgi:hypothetical protein
VSFTVGECAGCIAPPAPPVLLPATVVGNQVTLSWVAPGNSEVTGYRLLAGSSPGAGDRAVVDLGPVTSFAAQAAPGTYYLSLFASSGCGFSGASNIVVLQVAGVPAPNRLRSFFDGTSLVVLWDPVPGAASYVVDAGTTSGASDAAQISTGEGSIRVDAPPPGTFHVRVRSIDGTNASSAPSAEIVIVIR